MREGQTSVGVVEDSGFNLEIEITGFANGVDLGTEWQAGVKDASLGNCWATFNIPPDGEKLGQGEGRSRFGEESQVAGSGAVK